MAKVYIIPENFIEGGRILNTFKTRNFVEAVALTLLVGIPLWMIHYPSFQVKLMVVLCIAAPIFLISVTGINGDSLIQFLQQYLKWRKSKRIMLYNGQARSREVRAADVMMAQELAKDKIVDVVENWQEKRKQKNSDVSFIEGKDFVFLDDEEGYSSFVTTEKKLLGEPETEPVEKKKRRKKGKGQKLLTASNPNNGVTDDKSNAELNSNNGEYENIIVIDNKTVSRASHTDEIFDDSELVIEGEVVAIE